MDALSRRGRLYFGTNTKMSKTDAETLSFLSELRELTGALDLSRARLFVIPSFTVLSRAKSLLEGSGIMLGAQNMCHEDRGQFTGEVSPLSLRDIGIDLVELGHSERRHIFGETDQTIRLKVRRALSHGFSPLLCIGESAESKAYGTQDEVLAIQLYTALGGLTDEEARTCMVAYEPVWAIGVDGVPADPEYVMRRHRHIRDCLQSLCGQSTGGDIPVLYGGSVNEHNAEALIAQPDVDGLFVGRAAWTAAGYANLLKKVYPVFAKKPLHSVTATAD